MSTFKFIGNNRYFTGICTNDLVFDNKDSSENRIFCEESTCISAKYSGIMPITACRIEMLPSGYTDKIFEWGVEGGPWTTNVDYSGAFPNSPNEFIGAGALGNVKPPIDPTGNFFNSVTVNGRTTLSFNPNAFSDQFNPEQTSAAGYMALGGGRQFEIDPEGLIGSRGFEPVKDEFNRCNVSTIQYSKPEISYYDVGVSPVPPANHDVVFPYAFISGKSSWYDPTSPWMFDPNPPTGVVAFRNTYIAPAQATKASLGIKCPYSSGNHPPLPSLASYPEWNYNHVTVNNPGTYATGRVAANSRGAKVYHPLADTNDATKVIRGLTAGPEWHTGYRMQRHSQVLCSAKLGVPSTNSYIGFGFKDIETRIKALGYYAKWTLKSIVPEYFIILSSSYFQGAPGFPAGIYYNWGVRAIVTIEVSYHGFNSTINPIYNYEYGPEPSTSDPYYCNGATTEFGGWNPPFLKKALLANTCSPVLPPYLTGGHHYAIALAGATWEDQDSHHPTNPVSSNVSNPLSLKSLKKVNYYTLPMSWNAEFFTDVGNGPYYSPTVDTTYIAYQDQKFTQVFAPHPDTITTSYPSTPNDFKIWRRKV